VRYSRLLGEEKLMVIGSFNYEGEEYKVFVDCNCDFLIEDIFINVLQEKFERGEIRIINRFIRNKHKV